MTVCLKLRCDTQPGVRGQRIFTFSEFTVSATYASYNVYDKTNETENRTHTHTQNASLKIVRERLRTVCVQPYYLRSGAEYAFYRSVFKFILRLPKSFETLQQFGTKSYL